MLVPLASLTLALSPSLNDGPAPLPVTIRPYGLAVYPYTDTFLHDHSLIVLVSEADHGADLTGDGDLADWDIAHHIDLSTDQVTNSTLALVREVHFSEDPGDRRTRIVLDSSNDLFLFEPASGAIEDTGLTYSVWWNEPNFVVNDQWFAFTEYDDPIVNVIDDTGRTRPLFPGRVVALRGSTLVALALESDGVDINGDGESVGDIQVPVFVNLETGERQFVHVSLGYGDVVSNTPRFVAPVDENWWAALAPEWSSVAQEMNGDGDTDDRVLHVFSADGGTLLNTGLAALWPVAPCPVPGRPATSPGVLGLTVDERHHGADIDGDGVINGAPFASGQLFLVGSVRGGPPAVVPSVVHANEELSNTLQQWDGYATFWSSKWVHFPGIGLARERTLHLYDVDTGELERTRYSYEGGNDAPVAFPNPLRAHGPHVFFLRPEEGSDQEGIETLRVFDALSDTVVNYGISPVQSWHLDDRSIVAEGTRAVVRVDESAGGRDLDGDGEVTTANYALDLASGRSRVLSPGPDIPVALYQGDLLAFLPETALGRDANGDGDLVDSVIARVTIPWELLER